MDCRIRFARILCAETSMYSLALSNEKNSDRRIQCIDQPSSGGAQTNGRTIHQGWIFGIEANYKLIGDNGTRFEKV